MSIHGPEAQAQRFAAVAARLAGDGADISGWFVPGRIEVVGKHTDYAGGRSLVCAIDRGLCVAARPRTDDRISIEDLGRQSTVVLDAGETEPALHWAVYPLTVLRRLTANFGRLRGADIVFDSDLPSAAGLSSSSALMIGVLHALVRTNTLDRTETWRQNISNDQDLAAFAATIENGSSFRGLRGERGVGTEGGSQDHTAILCSTAHSLTQFSYKPTRLEAAVPFAPHLTFVVGVSGVRAQKTGSARENYNRAAQSAAEILERWRRTTGQEHPTLAEAIASAPAAAASLRAALHDRRDLVDRLDQFVEESFTIVPAARQALADGDFDGFGRIVDRSQSLSEGLLRNQVAETIALARLAREHGALAASAFGAGFGGSVWALVETAQAPAFSDRWQNAYRDVHPDVALRSAFFATWPGPPAFEVELPEGH
jgi:galactokinase